MTLEDHSLGWWAPAELANFVMYEKDGTTPFLKIAKLSVKVDLKPLKNVPTLVVWGDFMEGYERWMEIRTNISKYEDALRKAGAVVDHVDLPAAGIKGNSHMMMMDRNSDQVAGVVQKWFEKQGLMK